MFGILGRMKQGAIIDQLVELQQEKLINMRMHLAMFFSGASGYNDEASLLEHKRFYEQSISTEVIMREEVIKKAGKHMSGAIRNHLELLELLDMEMLKIVEDMIANVVDRQIIPWGDAKEQAFKQAADFMKNFQPRW